MAKNKTKKKREKAKSSERPWNTLAGLALGLVIMYALIWVGALRAGETVSQIYAKDYSRDWTAAVIENFSTKTDVFGPAGLKINDKYALQDFKKGTNIYRYSLVNEDGRVFESSNVDEKGRLENRPFFNDQVKNGEIISRRLEIPASQLDGYTLQSHVASIDSASVRQVVETAVPVMKDGKFVGAMFVFNDITNLLSWSNNHAKHFARILGGAITLIFLAIATMVWSYSSSRIKQTKALNSAKLEAERAEQEARDMAGKLQEMNDDVGKLNSELNKNLKIIRDTQNDVIRKGKLAQLGQLTATVAHDIRNPLGSVRTSAFLLRRKFADDNPTMEKPLARIEKGVERCDAIITQLLDFARSRDIHLKQHNLDDWLVNLLREQSEQLPSELSFECTLGLHDTEYAFDSDNLTRAVINFLANASEAMVGKDKSKPVVPTENPTIRVSTAKTERGIEISVSDNGPGISPENLGKILEPLFTTKSFGVGLGLPAVEKIFEQHGGGMEISSEEGKGATFTGWIAINQPDDQITETEVA